jgi:CRP/FNR family transcriptional regulator, cyclic AMP receptor protein
MSMHFERVLLLTKVPLFAYLRTDQLSRLAPLLEPVAWPKGVRVFDMGDMGLEMYILTSGRIGISVDPDPARQVFIAELKAGDALGEMALIDNEPRSASAHVLEDAQALALDKEKLHGLLMSYPELGVGMLRALSQRLRALNPILAKKDKA